MAVPAHDSRDFEFATTFSLPIRQVVAPHDDSCPDLPFAGKGRLMDSSLGEGGGGDLNGLSCEEGADRICAWLEESGRGRRKVNFKLRDWLFARQRYWGEPFPLITVEGVVKGLPETCLPLTLPEMEDFTPTGTGEAPLAKAVEWVSARCSRKGGWGGRGWGWGWAGGSLRLGLVCPGEYNRPRHGAGGRAGNEYNAAVGGVVLVRALGRDRWHGEADE